MAKFVPFFINSNLITDDNDISCVENYRKTIGKNIGNSYISWSIIKELYGGFVKPHHIKNIFQYNFSHCEEDIDFINNECTHCFLVLQDQIRMNICEHDANVYKNLSKFIEQIKVNLIVMSIGANQYFCYNPYEMKFEDKTLPLDDFSKNINKNLINLLHVISHKTSVIGIRGEYTQDVFKKFGIDNVQVIGCPSYFENGKNRIVEKKTFEEIKNVLISSPYNAFFGNKTFEQVNKNTDFNVQDEEVFVKTLFGGFQDGIQRYMDILPRSYLFSDIDSWKKFVKQHDFCWGYRIHGTVLSLNSGVPALFCPPDIKGTEMAKAFNIPYLNKILTKENFKEVYENVDYSFMNESYQCRYENFKNFMENNGIELNEEKKENTYETQPTAITRFHRGKSSDFEELDIKIEDVLLKNVHLKKELVLTKKTLVDKLEILTAKNEILLKEVIKSHKLNNLRIRLLSHITFGKTKQYYQKKWREIKKVLEK